MAQQRITVEFAVESVERLQRAVTRAIADATGKPALEPVSIMSPEGLRFLFIDEFNQEHWVLAKQAYQVDAWRQAWFVAR